MELPARDAVVHHRVICCYPDATEFLSNSIGATGSIYAFSMPRSRGIWGAIMRCEFVFENLGHRLKGRGFRAYIHDELIVEKALTEAGFALKSRSNRRSWFVSVYVK
jgi:magnesium-protoporphyrin O-methyltransferase